MFVCLLHYAKQGDILHQAQCTLCREIFVICLLHYAQQENIGARYTLCRDKCLDCDVYIYI